MSATPKPFSVVYNPDDGLQYEFATGYIAIPEAPLNSITTLTGDVTATGPGSAAATVVSVGGSTASQIATAVTQVGAAVSSNTPGTIVKRDGAGSFSAQVISSSQSLVSADNNNNGGAPDSSQLVVRGNTFSQEQIQIGYNTGSQYGYLQAAIYGFSTVPIVLQPIGGNVLIGTTIQDPSAIFQINSISQGILPPRMTNTQRDAIATPSEGLTIYSLTDHTLEFWNGTVWKVVATV